MTDSPDAIRADIERTRAELGSDVDALADKVTPSKMIKRQTGRVHEAVGGLRDRLMGAAHEATDATHGAADSAAHKATGNPLGVGLIAFGVGLVVASLIPPSRAERMAAARVKDSAQPLVDHAAGVAREMAGELKQPAADAATAVKDRAAEAAQHVADDSTDAAGTVRDRAQQAGENVRS